MSEKISVDTHKERPVFQFNQLKSKDALKRYGKELLTWSNGQTKDVQSKYTDFSNELVRLVKAKEEPTEADIAGLQDKLPVVEKRGEYNVDLLKRYHAKLKAHFAHLRDIAGVNHSDLYRKDGDKRDENYAKMYGRLNVLGDRITKLENGDDVTKTEFEAIKNELSGYLNEVRDNLDPEGKRKGGSEDKVDDKDDALDSDSKVKVHGNVDRDAAKAAYESATELNDKINAAVQLASASTADLKRVFAEHLAVNEKGKKQIALAAKRFDQELALFVTEVNSENVSLDKVRRVVDDLLKFVQKTFDLAEKHNLSNDLEMGDELARHLGIDKEELKEDLKSDKEEVNSDVYNEHMKSAQDQLKEAREYINSNDSLSDEEKQKALTRLESAWQEFFATANAGDSDRNATEVEFKEAVFKWSSEYAGIWEKVSPEFADWKSKRNEYRQARTNLHEELAKEQERQQSFTSRFAGLFNRKERNARMEELQDNFSETERRYMSAGDKYTALKISLLKERLRGEGKNESEITEYIDKRMDRLTGLHIGRGVWEGKTEAEMESPQGLKMFEQMATVHEKFRNLPTWKRYVIGATIIAGTPAAFAAAGGATTAAAAMAGGAAALRYGTITGISAVTGGFSFSKLFANRKFKKEGIKVAARKAELEQGLTEAKGETSVEKVGDVRALIKERNKAFLQSVRDQKVRAARSGFIGGAAFGVAAGASINELVESVANMPEAAVASGVESAVAPEVADVAPKMSPEPKIDINQPINLDVDDAIEITPESPTSPSVPETPTAPTVSESVNEVSVDSAVVANDAPVTSEASAEKVRSKVTFGEPIPRVSPESANVLYTAQRGDNFWDIMEGDTSAARPPVMDEISSAHEQALIDLIRDKINVMSAVERNNLGFGRTADSLSLGAKVNLSELNNLAREIAVEQGWLKSVVPVSETVAAPESVPPTRVSADAVVIPPPAAEVAVDVDRVVPPPVAEDAPVLKAELTPGPDDVTPTAAPSPSPELSVKTAAPESMVSEEAPTEVTPRPVAEDAPTLEVSSTDEVVNNAEVLSSVADKYNLTEEEMIKVYAEYGERGGSGVIDRALLETIALREQVASRIDSLLGVTGSGVLERVGDMSKSELMQSLDNLSERFTALGLSSEQAVKLEGFIRMIGRDAIEKMDSPEANLNSLLEQTVSDPRYGFDSLLGGSSTVYLDGSPAFDFNSTPSQT